MHAALRALNRLVTDRVIENYAIGGAIGASFYLPAMQTGRNKDYARVILFIEQHEVDLGMLSALASRYELSDRLARAVDAAELG